MANTKGNIDQINEYQKEIEALRKELANAKSDEQLKELKTKIDRLSARNKKLKEKDAISQAKIAEINEFYADLEKDYQAKIKAIEGQKEGYRSLYQDLYNKDTATRERTADIIKNEKNRADKAEEKLKSANRKLNANLRAKDNFKAERDQLRKDNKDLEATKAEKIAKDREEMIQAQISPAIRALFSVDEADKNRTNFDYKKVYKTMNKLEKKGPEAVDKKVREVIYKLEKLVKEKNNITALNLTDAERDDLSTRIKDTMTDKSIEYDKASTWKAMLKTNKIKTAFVVAACITVIAAVGTFFAFLFKGKSDTLQEENISMSQEIEDVKGSNVTKDQKIEELQQKLERYENANIAFEGNVDAAKFSNAMKGDQGGTITKITFANYNKESGLVEIVATGKGEEDQTIMSYLTCDYTKGKQGLNDGDLINILDKAEKKEATVYAGEIVEGTNAFTAVSTSKAKEGTNVQVNLIQVVDGVVSNHSESAFVNTKEAESQVVSALKIELANKHLVVVENENN